MVQAYKTSTFEAVLDITDTAATLSAVLYKTTSGADTSVDSSVTLTKRLGGYYFSTTFSEDGAYTLEVTKTDASKFYYPITVLPNTIELVHTAMDTFPDKNMYHADTSQLVTADAMMKFASYNDLAFAPGTTTNTPSYGRTQAPGTTTPTNRYAGIFANFSANDNLFATGMTAIVGVTQETTNTGILLPGAYRDTTIKLKLFRKVVNSPNDAAFFSDLIWESADLDPRAVGTQVSRSTVRHRTDPVYFFIYGYRLPVQSMPELALDGEYVLTVQTTGANPSPNVQDYDGGIRKGFLYEDAAFSLTGPSGSSYQGYTNYYGQIVQLTVHTPDTSILNTIDDGVQAIPTNPLLADDSRLPDAGEEIATLKSQNGFD